MERTTQEYGWLFDTLCDALLEENPAKLSEIMKSVLKSDLNWTVSEELLVLFLQHVSNNRKDAAKFAKFSITSFHSAAGDESAIILPDCPMF